MPENDEAPASSTSPMVQQSRARRRRRLKWEFVIGAAGLAVAAAAAVPSYLELNRHTDEATPPAPPVPTTTPGTPTPGPPGPSATPSRTGNHLDALQVEAGQANLGPLPPALRGQPGYDRPVVITCPSNAGADTYRDVTYLIKERYVDLSATVRPYFPDADDRDSKVYVATYVSLPQRDGTLAVNARGTQREALMGAPRLLDSDVSGAEKLTIRVQCEAPHGWVVLTGGVVGTG